MEEESFATSCGTPIVRSLGLSMKPPLLILRNPTVLWSVPTEQLSNESESYFTTVDYQHQCGAKLQLRFYISRTSFLLLDVLTLLRLRTGVVSNQTSRIYDHLDAPHMQRSPWRPMGVS